MTTPALQAPDAEWWTRPRVVLPIIGALVLIVALLAPQRVAGRAGDPRLSANVAGPLGARVLAQTAEKFGYAVVRREREPVPSGAPGHTIHAVLAPPMEVTDDEAHAYLNAVRAGDALLLVFNRGDALADSLRVRPSTRGYLLDVASADVAGCRRHRDLIPPLWFDGQVHLLGVHGPLAPAEPSVAFAPLVAEDTARAGDPGFAAVGFPLGRGRVIAIADPDLLRNDVLRRCRWGADVIAMRMIEWLRAGATEPRNTIEMDEFHQGFGERPTARGLVAEFLVDHPVGRAILVAAIGGLVLLLAAAPRPLVPRERETIERRDPLEQIDALAHAYEQVRATRIATARLLHGLRARLRVGAARHLNDEDFLMSVRTRVPARDADVALVQRALRERVDARELSAVGEALRRLEDTLSNTNV